MNHENKRSEPFAEKKRTKSNNILKKKTRIASFYRVAFFHLPVYPFVRSFVHSI